jgi:hypothetical protein
MGRAQTVQSRVNGGRGKFHAMMDLAMRICKKFSVNSFVASCIPVVAY